LWEHSSLSLAGEQCLSKRERIEDCNRVCISAWDSSTSWSDLKFVYSQEWHSCGRSCCRRKSLQDCQLIRFQEELSQDRRLPAKKTLTVNMASIAIPFSHWLQCCSCCLLLPAQQNISFTHIGLQKVSLFKQWHKDPYLERPSGNTTASYSQGHNRFHSHCILRKEEKKELLTQQILRHITMHARTHSEVFHLPSETFLVSFKANVLCMVLKYKFCNNTAGGNVRRGCQSTAAVYQVIDPRPPEHLSNESSALLLTLSAQTAFDFQKKPIYTGCRIPLGCLIQNLSLKSQLSQALHGSFLLSLWS